MLILLRTQVDRTDKTPVTARRARVGGLCGFRSPAERVPIQQQKTRRCADVREALQERQAQKKDDCERISAEGEAASGEQDKAAGSCAPRGGHICPPCGPFRGFTKELLSGQK